MLQKIYYSRYYEITIFLRNRYQNWPLCVSLKNSEEKLLEIQISLEIQ
jgi:hypothetical protein